MAWHLLALQEPLAFSDLVVGLEGWGNQVNGRQDNLGTGKSGQVNLTLMARILGRLWFGEKPNMWSPLIPMLGSRLSIWAKS